MTSWLLPVVLTMSPDDVCWLHLAYPFFLIIDNTKNQKGFITKCKNVVKVALSLWYTFHFLSKSIPFTHTYNGNSIHGNKTHVTVLMPSQLQKACLFSRFINVCVTVCLHSLLITQQTLVLYNMIYYYGLNAPLSWCRWWLTNVSLFLLNDIAAMIRVCMLQQPGKKAPCP